MPILITYSVTIPSEYFLTAYNLTNGKDKSYVEGLVYDSKVENPALNLIWNIGEIFLKPGRELAYLIHGDGEDR